MSRSSPVSLLRQRFPFAGVLIAAVCGILMTDQPPGVLSLGVVSVLVSVFVLALLLVMAGSSRLTLLCVALTMGLMHWWGWRESPSRKVAMRWVEEGGLHEIRGTVVQYPRQSRSGTQGFALRVTRISPSEGPKLEAPLTVMVRWEGDPVHYGDEVEFSAVPSFPDPPRNPGVMDYSRWLERRGIFLEYRVDPSVPGRVIGHDRGNPLMALSLRARKWAQRSLSVDLSGAPETVGTIQGICLGVTENAPEGFLDEFRFTGTMHLFAVSGLHVGMVAVILWFLLSMVRTPRSIAVLVLIVALAAYVMITGCKEGSVRAATMASLLALGLVFFRRSPPLNSLAAAACFQLVVDPNTLFSSGWQFSYSVVGSILLLGDPIRQRIIRWHEPDVFLPPRLLTKRERLTFGAWRELAGLVAVSLAAWVGSLVPTAVYFHLISFSALGANILAVPLAFAILSLGIMAVGGGLVSVWLAGACNNANWLVVKLLLLVIQGSALIPAGHWFIGSAANSTPRILLPDLHGASCAVICEPHGVMMINAGRLRDAARTLLPMLEWLGVNAISELVVTHAAAEGMGGIATLSGQIPIRSLYLPPDPGHSLVARKLYERESATTRLVNGEVLEVSPHDMVRVLHAEGDAAILRIDGGSISVLWMPGVERRDRHLRERLEGLDLRADLLVLPLAGISVEEGLALIRRVSPRAVISPVGGLGPGSAPSRQWGDILKAEGIVLFRQDETGAVLIDGGSHPLIRSYLPKGPSLSLSKETPETPSPR